MSDTTPRCYLSVSTSAAGTRDWRVILCGLPICADTDRAGAERAARFASLAPTDIWDGDKGEFVGIV